MGMCDSCGNDYEKSFEVTVDGKSYTFDCFECAIEALAPSCAHCETRIIGHGIEIEEQIFCCHHCARAMGAEDLETSEEEEKLVGT
jgi:hypothetical protein